MYSKSVAILRKKNWMCIRFIFHIYIMRQTAIVRILQYVATPHKKKKKEIDVVGLFVFIFIINCWNMCFTNENIIQAMQTWKQLVLQERLVGKLKGLRESERNCILEVRGYSQFYRLQSTRELHRWMDFFFRKIALLAIFFCIQCNCSGLSIAEFSSFFYVMKRKKYFGLLCNE